MEECQVLSKKEYGDIRFVSEMIGESHRNTDRILRRPTSKKYKKAIQALKEVIESRERLMQDAQASEIKNQEK